MPKHFSLDYVVKRLPVALLSEYLKMRQVTLFIEPNASSVLRTEDLLQAIRKTGKAKRDMIEYELRELHDHANQSFTDTILVTATKLCPPINVLPLIGSMACYYESCLWLLINETDLYETCLRLDNSNKLNMHKRKVPAVHCEPGQEEVAALKEAMSAESVRLGRGKGAECFVDQIGGMLRVYFILEHRARTEPDFDGRSRLRHVKLRPAYEVVFEYDHNRRTLETYAEGGSKLRHRAEMIFGITMLGVELPPEPGVHYDLNRFLANNFTLNLHPDDGIEQVYITQIRFDLLRSPVESVTLKFGECTPLAEMQRAIDRNFRESPFESGAHVGQIRLQVIFRHTTGRRKPSRSFSVWSDRCELGDDPKDAKLKHLLMRSNIDVFVSTVDGSLPTGTSIQRVLQLRSDSKLPS